MPDVDKVAGQGTRRNQDDVDANVVAGLGKSRDENFGGGCNAAQAVIVNREVKLGSATELRAFTSTKATMPARRATMSTSPAGVRTRSARIRQPFRRSQVAAKRSARRPRASAACRFTT